MRQPIGPGVEFAVAEHLTLKDQCRCLRTARNLRLKQLMNTQTNIIFRLNLVVHPYLQK
ncbi:hypothetical protein D3C78_1853270 [compost metagenome]